MHTLLLNAMLVLDVAIVAFLCRKEISAFLTDFLTVGEDLWTYTTTSGEIYEEVELQRVTDDKIVIRHRYGVSCLALDDLSEKTRDLLSRTQLWREHISAGPAGEKISTFPAVHAEAA
jgi:hypothetical protein